MQIVISYAREDRAVVAELAGTLRAWGHDAWTDAGAHSGARWWDEIVGRIQGCDVLLAVTSPASLVSNACTLERRYAMALNKVVLPVLVTPVNMQGLPPDLANIHFFDFTVRDVPAAGRLFQAVQQLPPSAPLPRPLPPPPAPPLSYLNAVADHISALPPDLDQQHRIVTALIGGLRSPDPEERAAATEFVRKFLQHPGKYHDPAERAREALARASSPQPGGPAEAPPPPPAKQSRITKVLAWIGGVTVALVGLGIWIGIEGSGAPTVAADVVSQRVYQDLWNKGLQPSTVQCGSLVAEVGATTYCEIPGLQPPGYTVRVTNVQGSDFSGWTYE